MKLREAVTVVSGLVFWSCLVWGGMALGQEEPAPPVGDLKGQAAPTEPPAEPRSPAGTAGEAAPEGTKEEGWQGGWEPAAPQESEILSTVGGEEGWGDEAEKVSERPFLDLEGYFRVRADLFHTLSLGTNGTSPILPPITESDSNEELNRGAETLAGANMRLRLNPVINVFEDVKIYAQIDVLDNVVLGSTPETLGPYSPIVFFTDSQVPAENEDNWVWDSIRVKRAWGSVNTDFFHLSFGRMGNHWGMGIWANDGNCLDCNYGDTVDRIAASTKIAGIYIFLSWDWAAEGYTSTTLSSQSLGQPYDLDQLDDVNQYTFALAYVYRPEEIRERLARGGVVLNGGIYNVFRNQSLEDFPLQPLGTSYDGLLLEPRDAFVWVPDLWFKLMYKKFRFEMEFVAHVGSIDHPDLNMNELDILAFGGVAQFEYLFLNDQLRVGLELGFATGDEEEGFGIRDRTILPSENIDGDMTSFKFDRDYIVDLILFREIIGGVTNATYFKPSVQYNIFPEFGAKLDILYAFANNIVSTPGNDLNLGLEFDVYIFYKSDENFQAILSYGILFPFGAFEAREELGFSENRDPEIAQTIQAHLIITF